MPYIEISTEIFTLLPLPPFTLLSQIQNEGLVPVYDEDKMTTKLKPSDLVRCYKQTL